jgi:penicillin-binding protein 1A
MGITPDIVAGCWVGFEQPSVHFYSTATGQGASAALPIVGKFLSKSYGDSRLKLNPTAAFPVLNVSDTAAAIKFDCSVIPKDTSGESPVAIPPVEEN